MKFKYVLTVFLLILFFVSNLSILNNFLPNCYPYKFCSDKGRFEDFELPKGHDPLWRVVHNFEIYTIENNKRDLVLHRRFSRKWWQVWNWLDFLFHPRWRYPYASNDEET